MDRDTLRSRLRSERRAFASGRNPLTMRPELEHWLRKAECVGLYRAMGAEPDLSGWASWCAANAIATALPRLSARDAPMAFARWLPGDALVDSGIGFAQPAEDAPLAAPDLILTPMLGFDRAMNRLGQGAGHYDRYFPIHIKSLRVGIAWSIQELESIRSEPWDIPMDAVCTESEWICPANSRMAKP